MTETIGHLNPDFPDVPPALQDLDAEMNQHMAEQQAQTEVMAFGKHSANQEAVASEYVGGHRAAPEATQQAGEQNLLFRGAARVANFMEGRRTARGYVGDKVTTAQEKIATGRIAARGIGLNVLDSAVDIKNDFASNVGELRDSVREDRRARADKAQARKETRRNDKMLNEAYKMDGKFDANKAKAAQKVENASKRQERRAATTQALKTMGKGALLGAGIVPAAALYGGYKLGEAGAKKAAEASRATAEYSREKVGTAKAVGKTVKEVQTMNYHNSRAAKARAKVAKHETKATVA